MNTKEIDKSYLSELFVAALRAIASRETNPETLVQVPGDFGRQKGRVEKILEDASSLEMAMPVSCVDDAQKACRTLRVDLPSNKINEIARAVSHALKATKNNLSTYASA